MRFNFFVIYCQNENERENVSIIFMNIMIKFALFLGLCLNYKEPVLLKLYQLFFKAKIENMYCTIHGRMTIGVAFFNSFY